MRVGARTSTIQHLRDAASGFRALVPLWLKLGDAERATHCALHAVLCDDLVEDLGRGSPKLLDSLAQESAGRGDWELAARYAERAARAEHDAATASDDA